MKGAGAGDPGGWGRGGAGSGVGGWWGRGAGGAGGAQELGSLRRTGGLGGLGRPGGFLGRPWGFGGAGGQESVGAGRAGGRGPSLNLKPQSLNPQT